jgi:hypothetical protein
MYKRAFITGIAVLFLATGTAHARSFEDYRCGKQTIELLFQKYFSTERTDCDGGPCDGKAHYFVVIKDHYSAHRVDRHVRWRNGMMFYKGRKCREFTEDEYNQ